MRIANEKNEKEELKSWRLNLLTSVNVSAPTNKELGFWTNWEQLQEILADVRKRETKSTELEWTPPCRNNKQKGTTKYVQLSFSQKQNGDWIRGLIYWYPPSPLKTEDIYGYWADRLVQSWREPHRSFWTGFPELLSTWVFILELVFILGIYSTGIYSRTIIPVIEVL